MITAGSWLIPGPARSGNYTDRPAENSSGSETNIIAPVTPMEAGFDDDVPSTDAVSNSLLRLIAPVTPTEANFNDDNNLKADLSPETPKEADFDEGI